MNPGLRLFFRAVMFTAISGPGISGCGQPDKPIQPEAPPSASAVAVEAPRPSPSPEPTPSPTAPEKPAPVAPVPARLSAEKLKLQVFAGKPSGAVYSGDVYHIYPAGDRMVVMPGLRALLDGRLIDMKGVKEIALAGEDASGGTSDKSLDEVTVKGVVGQYPDDLWIDVEAGWGFAMARSNSGTYTDRRYTYLRQFGKFGRVPDWPVAAHPWSRGRTLAYLGGGRFRLALHHRQKPDPLPKQAAGTSCPVRIDGKAMMAVPSGRVAVLGPDCDAEGALAVELWGTGSDEASLSKSEIVALPGAPKEKARGFWVFLDGAVTYAVAHYDSRSYIAEIKEGRAVEIESPYAHVAAAHMASDGALFLAGDDALYRFDGIADQKAGFTAFELPRTVKVGKQHGLFAESRDEVYWAVQPLDGSVILSTRSAPGDSPPPASAAPSASAPLPAFLTASAGPSASASAAPSAQVPAEQGTSSAAVSASALLDAFPALGESCATPLVILFPIAKSTPKDFDFAATKAELKDYPGVADLQLVEIEHGGERFLAAVVKDVKAASSLVLHLTSKKKDLPPKATCLPVPASARKIE